MGDERELSEVPTPSSWQEAYRTITRRQLLTARSVADLTLALRERERMLAEKLDALEGMLMARLAHRKGRARGEGEELSQKFPLMAGAAIELSSTRQKQLVHYALKGLFYLVVFFVGHVAAYFALPRPQAQAVPVSAPSPAHLTPALEPPRLP